MPAVLATDATCYLRKSHSKVKNIRATISSQTSVKCLVGNTLEHSTFTLQPGREQEASELLC